MNRGVIGVWMVGMLGGAGWSAPVHVTLSLPELVRSALAHSPKLEAAKKELDAAEASARQVEAAALPRVGVDGMYRYQTSVPSFSPIPGGPSTAFGSNHNWKLGLGLAWTGWDFGALESQAHSADAAVETKRQVWLTGRRQAALAVRLAYFQVQQQLEQVRMVGDAFKVAQRQYADIQKQVAAGAASRMDLLSSHQQVLEYRRQYRQAQAGVANALRDLANVAGMAEPGDLASVYDARMEGGAPEGLPPPTLWVSMDDLAASTTALGKNVETPPSDTLPQVKTFAWMAETARLASEAVAAQRLPRVVVTASSGYEYPNGPVLQTVQQNTVGLAVSMPLWDWGMLTDDAHAKQAQAEAYVNQGDQAKRDLKRDWGKAREWMRAFQDQQAEDRQAVEETEEVARLAYGAYQAGRLRYLEVESANNRALAAKVGAVRNDIQLVMQLAILTSWSGREE